MEVNRTWRRNSSIRPNYKLRRGVTELPQDPPISPEVAGALQFVYDEGRKKGDAEGYALGYKEGFQRALDLVNVAVNTLKSMDHNRGPVDEIEINDLSLSVRTYNLLKREAIHTVGDLLKKNEAYLKQIRNFDSKNLDEVKAKLQELGYELKQD
jgi:hypothetical protein